MVTSRLVGVLASAVVLAGCAGTDGDGSSASDNPADSSTSETPDDPTTSESPEDPTSESPDGSSAPGTKTGRKATGATIKGTGYTFKVPEGWDVPPQPIPGFDPDSMAFDLEDRDGFFDNVNVLQSPAGELSPERVETAGVKELKAVGAHHVSVEDRVVVAGNESAHLFARMSLGTNKYVTDQFYVTREGQTFVVTFSFSPSVSAGERARVTSATLSTWTWTG